MTKIKKTIISVLLTAAFAAVPVSAAMYASPFIKKTGTVKAGGGEFPCSLNLYADSPNYVTVELGPIKATRATYKCLITADCTYVDSSGNTKVNRQTANGTNTMASTRIDVLGSAPMYQKIVSVNYVEYNNEKGVQTLSYGN